METLQAALFDLDGVLVKSEPAWAAIVEEAGRVFRGRPILLEEFAPTFGQGTAADVSTFGLECTPAELDRFYVEQFSRHAGTVWVNPDAAPLLEELRARGLRLALVTNSVTPIAEALLAVGKLRPFFQILACADRVARSKPAPDLLRFALEGLSLAPAAALMVGDSRFDREAAAAAGVRFVGLGLDGDVRIDSLAGLRLHLGS